MKIVSLVLYIIMIMSLGLPAMALVYGKAAKPPLAERYSLSLIVGMGCLFLATLLWFAAGRTVSLAPVFAAAALLWFAALVSKAPALDWPRLREAARNAAWRGLRWYEWILLAFVLFQVLFLVFETLWRPVAMFDDWSHWAGAAKYLYHHGSVDNAYFSGNIHSDYPLFIMSNEIAVCLINGQWDDYLCKSPLTIMFIGFALFFYSAARRRSGRLTGIVFTLILVTIPMYVRVGIDGSAEIPISICLGVWAIAALRYLEAGGRADMLIAGLAGGMVAAIKAEGVYVVIALSALFLAAAVAKRKEGMAPFALYAGVILFFTLPWSYLKYAGGCEATRFTEFSMSWVADPQSYADISRAVLGVLVPSSKYFLLGTYSVVAAVFLFTKAGRSGDSLYLLAVMAVVGCVYAFGSYSVGWGSQFPRLLSHNTALALLFVRLQAEAVGAGGLHRGRLRQPEETRI